MSNIVRIRGIEPRSNAWEAFVLPLNYIRFAARTSHYTPPFTRIPTKRERPHLRGAAGLIAFLVGASPRDERLRFQVELRHCRLSVLVGVMRHDHVVTLHLHLVHGPK